VRRNYVHILESAIAHPKPLKIGIYQPTEKSGKQNSGASDAGRSSPLPPQTYERDHSRHAQELPADCSPEHAGLRPSFVCGDGVHIQNRHPELPDGALHGGQGNQSPIRPETLHWTYEGDHSDASPD
jgi:hypothetical protein